jgi:hypothetical protein
MVGLRVAYLAVLAGALVLGARATAEAVTSSMIVETRDITSVSRSPDGRLIVAGISHPDLRTNKRELSWAIVPVQGGGSPIAVPAGEEIYPSVSGAARGQRALWSNNGMWFYYLRRDGEQVQLWGTRRDGKLTRQVTHSKSDLTDLQPSADPDEFVVQLAPARDVLRKAEDDEDREGILYDDHVLGGFPLTGTFPVIDRWRNVRRADNGEWVPPGWSDGIEAVFNVRTRKLASVGATHGPTRPLAGASSSFVVVAVNAPAGIPSREYAGQYTLRWEPKPGQGTAQSCALRECISNQLTLLGQSNDEKEVYFVADSKQGRLGDRFPGISAIYAWNPNRNVVRLIHDAGGRLYDLDSPQGLTLESVAVVRREAVFAFSGADEPPRLEAIDLDTGSSRVLLDPNQSLRRLTRGRAEWRTWENSSGYPGRGVVIMPTNAQSGATYPMVITNYLCGSGFLRGGNADGGPEFVLADRGFIAVCVDIPIFEIMAREHEVGQIYSTFCDILAGLIADRSANGQLDRRRVGITGQSLGANAGAYCISHSKAYAAAAFRHGSAVERERWDLFETAAWRRDPVSGIYAQFGLPDPRSDPLRKWDAASVALRASEIDTPTLIQNNDTEYLFALPMYSAMLEERKPIEMYVFPQETHRLIQPVHRLVNYERQVDWFSYWLKNEEDESPSKEMQYARWNHLRSLTEPAR